MSESIAQILVHIDQLASDENVPSWVADPLHDEVAELRHLLDIEDDRCSCGHNYASHDDDVPGCDYLGKCAECSQPETCEDRSFACCEKLTNDEHLARYGYVSAGQEA